MERNTTDRQATDGPLDLPEGRVLANRYEVRRRISADITGATMVAFDRERGEEILLQVVLVHIADEEYFKQRLAHETKLASQIHQEGLARVFESGCEGNLCFITSELTEGTTLGQRLNETTVEHRRSAVGDVVRLGLAVSETLGRVHDKTVHGGVTPENIVFSDQGRVKLAGLGVGIMMRAGLRAMIGIPSGAAPYMAPEQLTDSKDIDHRTDQYAVAAILYEMLTGEAPVGRVKSARQKRSDIPVSLSKALDRALEVKPGDRFKNMQAFAAALTGRSSSRLRRRRAWFAAAMILAVVALSTTFPKWRSPVDSIMRVAHTDSEALTLAEQARILALTSAASWRKLANALPVGLSADIINRADEAVAEGERYLEAMAYEKAGDSFRSAVDLYESQVEAATRLFRNEPSRIADSACGLLEDLSTLGQRLDNRVTETARHLESCERILRVARTEDEREEGEGRRQEALAELQLLQRLKSLASANVLSASLRDEIRGTLNRADRELQDARYSEALSFYAEAKAKLDELLAWPDDAERALRSQLALARKAERVRSALGPAALGLAGVKVAFDEAAALIERGEKELAQGLVPEAVALFESANECIADVNARAATGLLSQARAYDEKRKGTAAILALNELLALDSNNTAARELRRKIHSYRLTNSIGMILAFVPPGEFLMGSSSDEPGRDDDERQRPVSLASGFYMGTTEVTQGQWFAVMKHNPSKWKGDDLPVEGVSWEEAVEFCRRLTDREGQVYHLPTEAEWEYACRAGTMTPFSVGTEISTDQANYDASQTYKEEGKGVFRGKTTPVRSFPPNAWGLYDMHGNVWEWCPDGYEYSDEAPLLASAKPALMEDWVLRGGSWRNRARFCRCANRVRYTESDGLANVGLRVVLESE
ncbi:MAG: SUMF1/EgtB/PvdO family nonheme iron enzyme [Phycisphaerales bacterium]|nr:MAG: SUMF1/EgtB/PvdO family nonheme iron enzyme [Phycisphaerales bacterium]